MFACLPLPCFSIQTGDNVVLAQQAGAVLLKSYAKLMSGESLEGGECAYFHTGKADASAPHSLAWGITEA